MGTIKENHQEPYDWNEESVYLIENDDYVEGGEDGVSNRQAKQLTRRTRNLHRRVEAVETAVPELAESVNTKDATVLRSAKEYTDARETVIDTSVDTKTATALRTAKDYADQIVAALVDNSPEALNTLQELAKALGNDPNFATTVLQQIGEKVSLETLNAGLAGKAPAAETKWGGDCNDWVTPGKHYFIAEDASAQTVANRPCNISFGLIYLAHADGTQLAFNYAGDFYIRHKHWSSGWAPWRTVYHSGNFNPASYSLTSHSHTAEQVGALPGYNGEFLTDMLTIKSAGIRNCNSTANAPFLYGMTLDFDNGAWYYRLAFDTGGGGIHYYNRINAGNYVYQGKLWHSGNFNPGNCLKIISAGTKNVTGAPFGNTQGKYVECVRQSNGYKLDHFLGHNNYAVVVTPRAARITAAVSAQDASTFYIMLSTMSGDSASCDFSYIMYDLS